MLPERVPVLAHAEVTLRPWGAASSALRALAAWALTLPEIERLEL